MTDSVVEQADRAKAELESKTGEFLNDLGRIEQKYAQQANEAEAMQELNGSMRRLFGQFKKFEEAVTFDPETLKKAQAKFRAATDAYFLKSYFMTRARTWPGGNPGDYETIEAIYRCAPLSSGIGRLLDLYFLSTTLAEAVKERKDFTKQLLREEIKKRTEPRLMNVASGSCREIIEISQEIKTSNARLICVDISSQALEFAAMRLSYANLGTDQVQFRKYNALKMINAERNIKEFGKQDIIYSIGLFDYLNDETLSRLLSSLYDCLNPGGILITSFKDKRHYEIYDYHWLVDWSSFYQRSIEEVYSIFATTNIASADLSIAHMKIPAIYFMLASKR